MDGELPVKKPAKKPVRRTAALKISALKFGDKNANRGTTRGRKALAASLQSYGAGRSILLDKKDRVIAGNKTLAQAKAAGHQNVIVVETDGTQLVAVRRTDLDLRDKKARALAVADNRVGELDLEWETDVLAELKKSVDLSPFFSEKEFQKMIGAVDVTPHPSMSMDLTYSVIVDLDVEEKQIELLTKLEGEGYKCRLLIS
jgi:hypothetical protein